jgi:Domain of unknown function (DUF4407)
MNGYFVGLATFLVGVAAAVIGELLSEEVRDRLEQIPRAVLLLAARRLDPNQRASVYHDEWLPELTYILKGAEARPITRLITGTRYAFGILVNTHRIARHLHRTASAELDHASTIPSAAAGNPRSFRGPGKFLIALSGARPEILERCPTEAVKFQSLGWAMLITCTMAATSMWFALTSAMGINVALAVPFALLWGLVILGIDRWLVTSMPSEGSRKWAISAPRLILAVLLGTLISTPLVLRIFQSEINNQIMVIRQQQAAAFISAQQHSSVDQQVTQWTTVVTGLEQVIDSHGAVTINPSTDPLIQSLNKELATEQNLQQAYYRQWQCQLYGGSGCPKGNGPLTQASENSYNLAAQEVNTLKGEIQTRVQQLTASDIASEQARYQQATSELPSARQQLNIATNRQDTLLVNFNATNEAENGLLIRLEALDMLANGNFTVTAARFLLFMLFLVIEVLPVTVKLLQPSGNYEKILKAFIKRELDDARRGLDHGHG